MVWPLGRNKTPEALNSKTYKNQSLCERVEADWVSRSRLYNLLDTSLGFKVWDLGFEAWGVEPLVLGFRRLRF